MCHLRCKQGNSSSALAQSKTDYDAFLGNAENLKAVRNALQDSQLSPQLRKTLEIMQKTFLCYITEDPNATAAKVCATASQALLPTHIVFTPCSDGVDSAINYAS